MPGQTAHLILLGTGALMSGLGFLCAIGTAASAGPLSGFAGNATRLRLRARALIVAGLFLLGMALISRSLATTGRNLLSEIVDLPDQTQTLEELDVQQQKLHVNLVSVQSAIERAVQTSFHSLREQLIGIEGRVYNVETSIGEGGEGSNEEKERIEALWRFAASLDTFSARLETQLEKRIEQFEHKLSDELAETATTIAETIVGRFEASERSAPGPVAASPSAAPAAAPQVSSAASANGSAAPAPPTKDEQPAAPLPESLGVFDALDDDGLPRQEGETESDTSPDSPLPRRQVDPQELRRDVYNIYELDDSDEDSLPGPGTPLA